MAGSLERIRVSARDAVSAKAVRGPPTVHPIRSTFTLEEFFILGFLKDREMYGLEIARSLAAHADVGLVSGTGVIYPILKMLVHEGALSTRRTGGTPRTYYRMTALGMERFTAIAKRLAGLNHAVQSLIAII